MDERRDQAGTTTVEENNKKKPIEFPVDIEGIRSLKVAKIFRDNTDRINHLDYSTDGELLITSSDDDQIIIYDCNNGVQKKVTNSKKYGVDLITFTHQNTTCIHGSNKLDDTIRYLSLHDNKYVRYFPGHTKKVTTICLSPFDDTFLSGSMDKTLRMWDLRSPNCHGFMQLPGTPVTSFDPEGLIFAAGVNNEMVKLYDLRSYDKGPFSNFKFLQSEHEWNSLKFSPDGKTILLCTSSNLRIIDSYNGKPLFTLDGFANTSNTCLEAGFTPDGKFVYSGSTDGQVHFWAANSDLKIHSINSEHPGPIRCIKFNPKYYTLASSCTNLALWLPSSDHFTD